MHSKSSNNKTHNGRDRATPAGSSHSSDATPSSVSVSTLLNDPVNAADKADHYSDDDQHSQSCVKTTLPGRAVTALPLLTPTTYQTLVSTLSALGPIASTSSKTVGSWGRHAFGSLQQASTSGVTRRRVSEGGNTSIVSSHDGHAPPPLSSSTAPAPDVDVDRMPGIDEEDINNNDNEINEDALSASIHHRPSKHDDPIYFSTWDTIHSSLSSSSTRVLVQVFHSGRIKVWDASSFADGGLVEVLCIDARKELTTEALAYPLCARFVPSSVSSSSEEEEEKGHEPILAILTNDNIIHLYSTQSHRVIKRLSTPDNTGQIANFQVNDRFLVAATIQPLSLHIWNTSTMELLPFSPITDLAPHPYDSTPVYCLSKGRLLAYSSTRAVNDGGGSGIIATSGWNDHYLGSNHLGTRAAAGGGATGGNTATTSAASSMGKQQSSSSAINNTGNTDYGETARRWGEGMMSHMKAVTDYGYSRYYGGSSSTGLTPPSNQHSPIYNRRQDTASSSSSSNAAAKNFSKSAPHPSSPFYSRSPDIGNGSLSSSPASGSSNRPTMYSPGPTSGAGNASTSSSVKVLDLVASMKSFETSSSSSRPTSAHQRSRSPQTTSNGISTPSSNVRDANPLLSIVAHFKPSKTHSLTLLSINPNGNLILTSSSEGHSFHVFELRPPSFVGNSTVRNTSPSRSSSNSKANANASALPGRMKKSHSLQASNPGFKVWHRYRLNRGLTVAQTISAQWSPDNRFVSVSTNKGTVHVYPINPLGGKATPESHLSDTVKNEKSLARLSETVNAVARIKAPRLPSSTNLEKVSQEGENKEKSALENSHAVMTSPPDMLFVPSDVLPVHGPHASRSFKATSNSNNSRTISLVLFYPHLHSILQSNLHLSSSPKTAPSDAPLSTRVTSQAVSGLTQMMRNRGSALPTFESEILLARQEWISQWPLAAIVNDASLEEVEDIRVDLSQVNRNSTTKGGQNAANRMRITSAHEAELESFSHAPAVLPRSIYLAQTLTFHTYPPGTASKQGGNNLIQHFSQGNFTIGKSSKVVVREEVSHRFGSSSYAGGGSGEPFDESTELHSAMHTILDATDFSPHSEGAVNGRTGKQGGYGYSPNSHSPAFPNGYGKTSSSNKWLPSPSLASLPIPISISPQTVRQAATKVRKYSSSMRSPRLNAVGSSGSGNTTVGGGGHSLQGSTLSFEDDDAVLAQIPPEMMEIEEEGVDLGRRAPYQSHGSRQSHIVDVPSSARTDKYGSPSPAPLPSLSTGGTASSAESQAAKSTDSPDPLHPHRGDRRREDEDPSPPLNASSLADADEEGRHEGEWDSFKLEGIDDEDDLRNSAPTPMISKKQKLPSPLLSHAMLPILAAKSEQHAATGGGTAAQKNINRETLATSSPSLEDQKSILAVPGAFTTTTTTTDAPISSVGTALDMAYKPLEPEASSAAVQSTISETPLISPTLMKHHEASAAPSPLSSSPAVSSAAEFSASPATAGVLASKRNGKKKTKKGGKA